MTPTAEPPSKPERPDDVPERRSTPAPHSPAPPSPDAGDASRSGTGDKEWWEHLLDDTDPVAFAEASAAERKAGLPAVTEAGADKFVRPDPPPLPYFAPAAVISALAVLAGLVLLIKPDWVPLVGYPASLLIAATFVVGGGAGLIARLRNPDPDEPEDPDEGAVV